MSNIKERTLLTILIGLTIAVLPLSAQTTKNESRYTMGEEAQLIQSKEEKNFYLGFYSGIWIQNEDDLSPCFGLIINPSVFNKITLPIEGSINYLKTQSDKKWIGRISMSVRYSEPTGNKNALFGETGVGILFWEAPINYHLGIGYNYDRLIIRTTLLLWHESNDTEQIFHNRFILSMGIMF